MTTITRERLAAEVVVVGAGPAGCAAAWDLAAAGVEVLLLDRHDFPRFKPCAGGLTIKTLRRLRYPVTPVVRLLTRDFVAGKAGRPDRRFSGEPVCALTVRQELDDYCLRQTLARGAGFQRIDTIAALREEGDRVVLETASGSTITARWLLGADGAHSRVRRLIGLFRPAGTAVALEACVPLAAVAAMPRFTFDFHEVRQGYGWLFPKGDHVNVGLYTQRAHQVPISREQLRQYAQRRLGTAALEQVQGYPISTGGEWGVPASQRVLLAGDAAGFAEPLLGEGLHNAVLSGQLAAEAILLARQSGGLPGHYRRLLEPLRRDLYNSRVAANVFYGWPWLGDWLMNRALGDRMMRGMAAGQTFSGCLIGGREPVADGLPAAYAQL